MNDAVRVGLLCCLAASLAHALSFGPPELEKAHWESRQLTAVDVSGDGLTDLAYVSGVERSIDLLVQRKKPELAPSKAKDAVPPMVMTRFSRERIPTEAAPSAFVFGDFSGKGKVEVAYAAKKLGIVFLERQADGRWVETHRISDVEPLPYTHVLWAGALAKGEPVSLVALVKGRVLVIRDYKVAASYGTLYEDSGYVCLEDVSGDGRLDILYDYETPRGLAYRLQDERGRFDVERVQTYAAESEKNFAYRGERFFFFGGNTPFVEERKLTPSALKPQVNFYGGYADRAEGTLLPLDDGEGFLLADAKGSEMILYRRGKTGEWGSQERFPSLKSVSDVVALASEKGASVALFSADEHAVGVSSYEAKERRMSFPKLLELSDEPVALAGVDGRAWVVTRGDRDFSLQRIYADGSVGEHQKLEGLKRAPEGVLALNERGQTLLAVMQGREGTLFYAVSAKGEVSAVKTAVALARANFAGLEPSRAGRADLDGDGMDELMVTSRSSLRIFKFSKGELTLAEAVLPLLQDVNLRFPFMQAGALWAYDTKANRWLKFEKDAEKLWRNTEQKDGSVLDPQSVVLEPRGWIAVGRRAFYTFDPSAPGMTLTPGKRWESGLKVDGYNWASLENLEGDKAPEVILYNQPKKILEVVQWGEKPKSLLNFEVYKLDPHYSGRTGEEIEPREIIAADVTGDGKPDLVLLVHNRVVVYPQK